MPSLSTVCVVSGPPGSGKSYRRCARFIFDEFLPEHVGVHYSNFPIKKEVLVAAYCAKHKDATVEGINARVQVVPEDVLLTWRAGTSGPWEYFADKNIEDCHIAIDECHIFCGKRSQHKLKEQWVLWLGEVRHQGATVELLSQHVRKVATEVLDHAEIRITLTNSELRRDPYFHVIMGDWYELRAGFLTGKYNSCVWEAERRQVDEKWRTEDARSFQLDPFYFQFYDSYSRPQTGLGKGASGKVREYQRRGKVGLAWWFLRRNWWRFLSRLFVAGVMLWLMCGGGSTCMGWWLSLMSHIQQANATHARGGSAAVVKPVEVSPEADPAWLNSMLPADKLSPQGQARLRDLLVRHRDQVLAEELDKTGQGYQLRRLKVLEADGEASAKKIAELEREVQRGSDIALITREEVVFRGGYDYRVGEVIDWGRYKGRRVVDISWARRTVRFDDGQVVRLGRMVEEKDAGSKLVDKASTAVSNVATGKVAPQ